MTNLLEDIKQWVMPTPQWILTPRAETKLDAIGALEPIKNVFNQAVANTNTAYSGIVPNIFAGITTTASLAVIAVVTVTLYLVFKK